MTYKIKNLSFGNWANLKRHFHFNNWSAADLDSRVKLGDNNTSFHVSMYDNRDEFAFRIVNFPHMDSIILTKPARLRCFHKVVDFADRHSKQGFKLRENRAGSKDKSLLKRLSPVVFSEVRGGGGLFEDKESLEIRAFHGHEISSANFCRTYMN